MKKYEEVLKTMADPVAMSQITQKMDLRGLMSYAKDKGKKVSQLSEKEKMMFLK